MTERETISCIYVNAKCRGLYVTGTIDSGVGYRDPAQLLCVHSEMGSQKKEEARYKTYEFGNISRE